MIGTDGVHTSNESFTEVDQTPVVSFSWEVLGCLYTQPIELNQGDRCSRLQFDHTKVKCKSLQGIVS